MKAREADRVHNLTPAGNVGPVEQKLISLGDVSGVVSGNFGEVSEDTHALIASLATSRVRVAGPSRGRRGMTRSEDGARAVAISALRRRLGTDSEMPMLLTFGPTGGARPWHSCCSREAVASS